MTKCKKINHLDGVVAKVTNKKDGTVCAEFSFMLEGESLARVRMCEEQLYQFRTIIDKMVNAISRHKSESDFRITE